MTASGIYVPSACLDGDAAVRQDWCAAGAIQHELNLESTAQVILYRMIERNLNCPVTPSAGRLFDAVAPLTGIALESAFEGQAAMLLECATRTCTDIAGS